MHVPPMGITVQEPSLAQQAKGCGQSGVGGQVEPVAGVPSQGSPGGTTVHVPSLAQQATGCWQAVAGGQTESARGEPLQIWPTRITTQEPSARQQVLACAQAGIGGQVVPSPRYPPEHAPEPVVIVHAPVLRQHAPVAAPAGWQVEVPGTVKTSEKARTAKVAPVFALLMSATFSRHVAFASRPLKAESGALGWNVPDHGAPLETIDWIALPPASSSTV